MFKKFQKQRGFTLIEVVVLISIVGIFSAITVSVINVGTQKAKTQDAKKKANVTRIADLLEAYCLNEGACPQTSVSDKNPFLGNDVNKLEEYITEWPSNDDATYYYRRYERFDQEDENAPEGQDFVLYVEKSAYPGTYFKYSSLWGELRDCGSGNNVNQITRLDLCPN